MELSCPHGTTRLVPHEKFPLKPYNKSFIVQVWSVKMAGYCPRSFFVSLWTSTPFRSRSTQKKNLALISSQLGQWNNPILIQKIARRSGAILPRPWPKILLETARLLSGVYVLCSYCVRKVYKTCNTRAKWGIRTLFLVVNFYATATVYFKATLLQV